MKKEMLRAITKVSIWMTVGAGVILNMTGVNPDMNSVLGNKNTWTMVAEAAQMQARNLVWQLGENGKYYWYEQDIRQGTIQDTKGVWGDGTIRGREIYDPTSNGWYWLDACYNGAKATGKEVWMPYVYQNEKEWNASDIEAVARNSEGQMQQVIETITAGCGKWVRYDDEGKMYKGWYAVTGAEAERYPEQAGNIYYYDMVTGLMAKGTVCIDGVNYTFDLVTGALLGSENYLVESVEIKARHMVENQSYPKHEGEELSGDYTDFTYDAWGNCTARLRYHQDGSLRSYERFAYDILGRETEYYKYENGVEYLYIKTDYQSNTKTERYFTKEGRCNFCITYEYDAKGNVLREIVANSAGTVMSTDTYIYDTNGRLSEKCTYNSKGEMGSKINFLFSMNGRQEVLCGYDRNGNMISRRVEEYDDNHRLVMSSGGQLVMVDGGGYWGESQHYYSYDLQGNRIRHAVYTDDLLENGTISEYKNILVMR